jgi:hypothetical protein
MREFLQLDRNQAERTKIPADVVIFLFSHDRVTRFDFEFFKEVDAIYRRRLLLVKNTKGTETSSDMLRNTEAIESRTARRPLPVDALGGAGTQEVIREVLRMLPVSRLQEFNRSLAAYRQKAHAMARAYATKYAAIAVVERGTSSTLVRSRVEKLRQELYSAIAKSYVDDLVISQRLGDPAKLIVEDSTAEARARGVAGGLFGGLIGLLGGPIGMALVGFLGAVFGAGTTQRKLRGGSQAAIEMFAYALGVSAVLDKVAAEPMLFFSQSAAQVSSWLEDHQAEVLGSIAVGRSRASQEVTRNALTEFLNHPNTLDRAEIEARLRPVADALFS